MLPRTALVLCLLSKPTMLPFRYLAVVVLMVVATSAQDYEFSANPRPAPARLDGGYSGSVKPTPVPILKQINRHNEDGSYTYGYEGADGSFKIETKLPTGDVKGKYGYVDDTGKVRVVEYGATKYGFEPAGEGITVAPPTLVDETTNKDGLQITQDYDDDSRAQQRPIYRPQPAPIQYQPPQRSAAPVPQRLQIPGAAPSPSASFEFGSGPSPVRSFGPAPARPSLSAYASPAPIEENTYDAPTPRPKISYAQPRPQPSYQFGASPAATQAITRPQQAQFQPQYQPQYQPQQQQQQYQQPQPQPQQQYAPRPSGNRAGGVLDQLAKDYALPANAGAPLHDISFGYY